MLGDSTTRVIDSCLQPGCGMTRYNNRATHLPYVIFGVVRCGWKTQVLGLQKHPHLYQHVHTILETDEEEVPERARAPPPCLRRGRSYMPDACHVSLAGVVSTCLVTQPLLLTFFSMNVVAKYNAGEARNHQDNCVLWAYEGHSRHVDIKPM